MRRYLAAVILGSLFCTGCLTVEEKKELKAKGAEVAREIDALTALAADLTAKYQKGEISLQDFKDALAVIDKAKGTALTTKKEIDEKLEGRPWYDRVEAWLQILLGGIVGLGGATATSRVRRKVGLISGKPKG